MFELYDKENKRFNCIHHIFEKVFFKKKKKKNDFWTFFSFVFLIDIQINEINCDYWKKTKTKQQQQ